MARPSRTGPVGLYRKDALILVPLDLPGRHVRRPSERGTPVAQTGRNSGKRARSSLSERAETDSGGRRGAGGSDPSPAG